MKAIAFIFTLVVLPYGQLLAAATPGDLPAGTNISRFGAHPCWSPDSRRIAFSICGCVRARGGIWVFDVQTRKTQQVHDTGFFPSWSPSGDRIAFVHDSHPMLMTTDGGDLRDTGLSAGWGLQWSPDGRFMLCADGSRSPARGLLLTDTHSWTQSQLEFHKAGPSGAVSDFAWTYAGEILLTAPVAGTGGWLQHEIREFTVGGEWIRTISLRDFDRKPFGLRVSPDGKFLAFGRGSRGIWIANSDGSDAKQVLPVGAAPAWSPDKRWLAYDDSSSTSDTHNGVFLLDIRLHLP